MAAQASYGLRLACGRGWPSYGERSDASSYDALTSEQA